MVSWWLTGKNKDQPKTILRNIGKIKTMGNITPNMNQTDRWEIPILNLICHVPS